MRRFFSHTYHLNVPYSLFLVELSQSRYSSSTEYTIYIFCVRLFMKPVNYSVLQTFVLRVKLFTAHHTSRNTRKTVKAVKLFVTLTDFLAVFSLYSFYFVW